MHDDDDPKDRLRSLRKALGTVQAELADRPGTGYVDNDANTKRRRERLERAADLLEKDVAHAGQTDHTPPPPGHPSRRWLRLLTTIDGVSTQIVHLWKEPPPGEAAAVKTRRHALEDTYEFLKEEQHRETAAESHGIPVATHLPHERTRTDAHTPIRT